MARVLTQPPIALHGDEVKGTPFALLKTGDDKDQWLVIMANKNDIPIQAVKVGNFPPEIPIRTQLNNLNKPNVSRPMVHFIVGGGNIATDRVQPSHRYSL